MTDSTGYSFSPEEAAVRRWLVPVAVVLIFGAVAVILLDALGVLTPA